MNRIIIFAIIFAILAWVAALNMARADDNFGHSLHDITPYEHHHDEGDDEEHHEHDDHMYYEHGIGHHDGGDHHDENDD